MKQLDIKLDIKALVKNLSVAQMQMVELIRATSYGADVIIMDEPTSALADDELRRFTGLWRIYPERRIHYFISHKLEEIFDI